MQTGQIVYSKCGRDKGKPFIIYSVEGEYVYLVDGSAHLLDKPKKKKNKHVQITNSVNSYIKERIDNNLYLNNADFRKALEGCL